ncbi:MAG: hypothetical protein U9N02_05895 [Campylobacterota bacterium]|nr:hypothetical protein [Campylobacterota bacterium]
MRLTLTDNEFNLLLNTLQKHNEDDLVKILLSKKIKYDKSITPLKRNATKKATLAKEKMSKIKISNAVNLMRLMNSKINVNSVAKESGLAYNTVKKYKNLL